MVAFLGAAALATVATFQALLDRRIWGTRVTPGSALTVGYAVIAVVYALAWPFFEFNPIPARTYVVLCALGLITAGLSMLVCFSVGWEQLEMEIPPRATGATLRLVVIAAVCVYGLVAFRLAVSSGGVWSAESRETFASGIVGHAGVALSFLLIWYAAGTADGGKTRLLILGAGVLALSLNPVKGWTVIPLIAIGFAEALTRRRDAPRAASSRPLLVAVVAGVAVFFGIYLSRALAAGIDTTLLGAATREVLTHLLFYLTSGLFGFDAVLDGLRLPGGLPVLLAPLANSTSFLTGDGYVQIISDVYVVGLLGHGDGGNVYSMYGSLIAYVGSWGVALAAVIIAFSYLIFAWSWRLRLSAVRVASFYLMAILAFGWFEYYFWHLTPFEILCYAAAAGLLEFMLPGVRREGRAAGAGELRPHSSVG